jgi:hypothetical protein
MVVDSIFALLYAGLARIPHSCARRLARSKFVRRTLKYSLCYTYGEAWGRAVHEVYLGPVNIRRGANMSWNKETGAICVGRE